MCCWILYLIVVQLLFISSVIIEQWDVFSYIMKLLAPFNLSKENIKLNIISVL